MKPTFYVQYIRRPYLVFFTQRILKGKDFFCVCDCTCKIADCYVDSNRLIVHVEAHADYEPVNCVHREALIAQFTGTLTFLAAIL